MRLLIALLVNTLAIIITAYLVPGFTIEGFSSVTGLTMDGIKTAVIAAIVLGVINTFIKPVLVLLTIPLTIVTLGLFIFVINAVILWIAAGIVPGMHIAGFWTAIIAALVLSVVSTILSLLTKGVGRDD